jgi:hypothetical protein
MIIGCILCGEFVNTGSIEKRKIVLLYKSIIIPIVGEKYANKTCCREPYLDNAVCNNINNYKIVFRLDRSALYSTQVRIAILLTECYNILGGGEYET